jgi:parallel beta-helix repeat protein
VSELFSNSNKGSRHRVVIDKVERVRNEPLSLSFKRLLKSLSSQDVIQRLYFPVAADTQMRKQHEQQGQQQQQYSAEEEQILSSGFASSSVSGPFGNGVYFPCTFTVFKVRTKKRRNILNETFFFFLNVISFQPSAVFRVIVCDVAVGKSLIYDESGAVVPSLQDGLFDSVSYSPGLVSRSNAAVKEDLVIKSPVQACPRFVVTFSLHSTDASRGIRVVSADGLGDHRSIQEALDAAASGDLILLRPNTYCESLHISKDVQLMASLGGVAVLEGVLTIASSCQLSGLHVRLTGGSSVDNSVAVAVEGGSPALANCDVAGMVTVANAAQLVLRDCRVHDSAKHGVHVAARSTCLVEKCTIDTMAECGVQVDAGGRGVIMNSSVTKCLQNGIYLLDGAKGVIEGCNISGCSYPGIAVSSADPVITRNRIHHNERSGLVIAGRSDDNTLVEDNNIFSNGRDGVMIAKDAVCLFQGNAIFDNKGSGVQITTGANPQFVKTHVYSNKDSGIVISKGGNAHISGLFFFFFY